VQLAGWVQSNGSYGIAISGSMTFGNRFFGFEASLSAKLYYIFELEELGFSGSLQGKVYLCGVGLGLGTALNYNSSTGSVTVSVAADIDFLFFTKRVERTWTVGHIALRPKPFWLATTSEGRVLVDESSLAGDDGVLSLTIENQRARVFDGDDLNPTYTVSHLSTQADGSETVMVAYNGRVKTYSGVRKILANSSDSIGANVGGGKVINSTIYVREGITSQLEFHGGSGDDSYYIDGGSITAMNIITGDSGDDVIIVGGSENRRRFRIEGGEGVNELEAGAGDDEIIVGSGVNYIIGNLGSDVIRTAGGTNFILGDQGSMSVPPGYSFAPRISTIGTSGGNDTVYTTAGTYLILGGLGNDTIHGSAATTVVGDDLESPGAHRERLAAGLPVPP
jgi:Ca2+-binding RTX toxin-like protein